MRMFWLWSGCLVASLIYIWLIGSILVGRVKQSFATWALWTALDTIALVSIILQHGNYLLLVFYCLGGVLITASLLYKKQFIWTNFETFVLILVVICLIIWWTSGSRMATISSSSAMLIASLPQIKDSWTAKRDKEVAWMYFGYTLANTMSLFGGKNWSIEERFYPFICVVICISIFLSAIRKNGTETMPAGNP